MKIEAIIQPFKLDEVKKVKLEMVAADLRVEQVMKVLGEAARTGKIGDGKVFVTAIEDALRIRNGERGESAL